MTQQSEVTRLLHRLNDGDEQAGQHLLPLVYSELHQLARSHMARERGEHSWQPTALIHELYLRLVGGAQPEWRDTDHFLRIASRSMRNILVDHARAKAAQRAGGDRDRVALDDALAIYADRGLDVLALNEALADLGDRDPDLVEVVEMRFFAGLPFEDIAAALGVTERTVYRRWCLARALLRGSLDEP